MENLKMHTCPLLPRCGAAPLSHMPYSKQVDYKQEHFKEAFKKVGAKVPDFKFVPAPLPYFYRNRMDYTISYKGEFGLREKGKWWKVLDGHACIVADKTIRKAFKKVYKWVKATNLPYYDRKKHTGFLKYAVIRTNLAGELLINIITNPLENCKLDKKQLVSEFEKLISIFEPMPINLVLSATPVKSDRSIGTVYKVLHGNNFLVQKINRFKYIVYANAFFQNNPYVAKLLQKELLKQVNDIISQVGNIYDLYGGSGFFGISIASKFRHPVLVVEEFAEATKSGKQNARLNHVENLVQFKTTSVDKFLADVYFSSKQGDEDLFILDPPRAGLTSKVLRFLIEVGPKFLIYISCKYTRFIEEFYKLGLNTKYEIKNALVFDMFPQTEHVESLFYLIRK